MEFLDKLGETITTKSREATDKAKDLAEIANLKGKIGTCESSIRKNYIEIGRIYYEKHGDEPEQAYVAACRDITVAKSDIAELEKRIREVKGI